MIVDRLDRIDALSALGPLAPGFSEPFLREGRGALNRRPGVIDAEKLFARLLAIRSDVDGSLKNPHTIPTPFSPDIIKRNASSY